MDERKNEPQDGALFVTEAPAKDAARRKKADDQRGAPGDGKAEESAELLDEIRACLRENESQRGNVKVRGQAC